MYKGDLLVCLSDFAMEWNIQFCYDDGLFEDLDLNPAEFRAYLLNNKSDIKRIKIFKSSVPSTLRKATDIIEKEGLKYEVLG